MLSFYLPCCIYKISVLLIYFIHFGIHFIFLNDDEVRTYKFILELNSNNILIQADFLRKKNIINVSVLRIQDTQKCQIVILR